jgi:hypothetical protein
MKNLKSSMLRTLVALAMFSSAGQLFASPVYHVSIDSAGLSGQGYLDFLFLGTGSSATADVQLTNFTGDFDKSTTTKSNAEGSLDSGVTIHNDTGWNEFGQLANFGGLFNFDVQFSIANDATGGSDLSIALLDSGLNGYVGGTAGDLATFQVYPGQPSSFIVSDRAAVEPAVVPEPATLANMAAGLMLLFGTLRSRRRR